MMLVAKRTERFSATGSSGSSRRVRSVRSGFTLIELLVVIAIIAILAAILFPVFATARERARQTTCMSNQKQIGLAVKQYNQDYDGLMPLVYITNPNGAGNVPSRRTVAALLVPYMGTGQAQPRAGSGGTRYGASAFVMYKCPNLIESIAGGQSLWDGSSPFAYEQNVGIWSGFGWNQDYMNFDKTFTCGEFGANGIENAGPPTNEAAIPSPAATVMYVSSAYADGAGSFARPPTELYPINGGDYRAWSPAGVTTPEGCTYSNAGWGQGSFLGPFGGFDQPRHGNLGGPVGFADGHVKVMNAGQLAAGTNWSKDTQNGSVRVTNRPAYLWDLDNP